MTTYPGTGSKPDGIAFDDTNMWTVNAADNGYNGSVTKISPTGTMTTYFGSFGWPISIAFDGTNMWTANKWGGGVTKISPTGTLTNYTNQWGVGPYGIAFDGTNMWTADTDDDSVMEISPTGTTTRYTMPSGTGPDAIAFASTTHTMWTADSGNNSVTKISATGTMTTYTGIGSYPDGIAFDGTNMWTANKYDSSVTEISPTGTITAYPGPASPTGIAFDGTNMWTVNEGDNGVTEISPTGTMTTYTGTDAFPLGIAFDGANMWTANQNGNSVTKIAIADEPSVPGGSIMANGLLGQQSYTTSAPYGGQGSVNAQGFGDPGGTVFNTAVSDALDTINHRLFVSDFGNHRILVYQLDATNNITTTTPQNVLGACNFVTSGNAGASSSTFDFPNVTYDPVNSRLFVSDGNNNRVLTFNVAPAFIHNCEGATFVLGQSDFVSDVEGGGQNGLWAPDDIDYDSVNSRLFVSDGKNNRVMVFSVPGNATSSINGENAIFELGQPDFNTTSQGYPPNGLGITAGEAYDPVNSRLFVSDYEGNHVMVFSVPGNATSSINGENDIFILCNGSTVQSSCSGPDDIDYDSINNRLFVGDKNNNRIVIFNVPSNATSSISGENAKNIIGQSSWGSNTSGLSQKKGNWLDSNHAYDVVNNRTYIEDNFNSRILEFSMIHITTHSLPSSTVGSSYSQPIVVTSTQGTSQTYSIFSGALPTGLSLNPSTGVISGTPTVATTTTVTVEADDNFATGPFFDRATYTMQSMNPLVASLSVTPTTSLQYAATQGNVSTSSQSVVVGNIGGTPGSTLNWSASSNQSWLTFNPASGTLGVNVTTSVALIVNPAGLAVGTYNATATIADPAATNSPQTIPVILTVNAPAPASSVSAPSTNFSGGSSYQNVATTSVVTSTNSSSPSSTPSTSSLQATINSLMAELQNLQKQSASGTGIVTSTPFIFSKNLELWDTGPEVTALQRYLISQNKGPAAIKLKMHGLTSTFGTLTLNALIEFQKSVGIIPASGYFGSITRARINAWAK